jgi:retron-type reverse transcriptase
VSLDVNDLFNNVPINKAIDIVLKRIERSKEFRESNLTKSDLKQLLTLCLNNSYFVFNNKYYKQIRGLPIRHIWSPLLADLYMHEFINDNLNKTKERLYRYVDDLFVITKMNENIMLINWIRKEQVLNLRMNMKRMKNWIS